MAVDPLVRRILFASIPIYEQVSKTMTSNIVSVDVLSARLIRPRTLHSLIETGFVHRSANGVALI